MRGLRQIIDEQREGVKATWEGADQRFKRPVLPAGGSATVMFWTHSEGGRRRDHHTEVATVSL